MHKFIRHRLLSLAAICGALMIPIDKAIASEDCTGVNEYPNWTAQDYPAGPYNHANDGDQMVYQNTLYEANWYTSSVPGSDQSWTLIGPCNGSGSSSSSSSSSSTSSSGSLPTGWLNQDIGSVGVAGSATPNTDGTISVTASGYDIGHDLDAFHFLYTPLEDDGEITAYVDIDPANAPSDWTKLGVMIRGDLDANAENYAFVLRPQYGSQSQYRPAKNYGSTMNSWVENPNRDDGFFRHKRHVNFVDKDTTAYRSRYLQPGKWLKAVRKGDTVLSYSSDDGECWNLRSRHDDINFGSQTYAGIVLSSHVSNQLASATVSNVSVNEDPSDDVNENCERSQVDGEIAPPDSNDWIVTPGVFGGDTWSITFTNPNPAQRPASCRSRWGSEYRRYYDDATVCPAEDTDAPWTQASYNTSSAGIWQDLQPGGFGNRGVGRPEYTQTSFNQQEFWLRKEVDLDPIDFNKIIFWGRWSNSASIYINGVLATNVHNSWMSEAYHYLGVRDEARAALVDGINVITAHIDCHDCANAYADFGLARHDKLGSYPVNNAFPSNDPNSKTTKVAKVFTDNIKERALLGGAFAYRENGTLVESLSLGWRDATLQDPIPQNPILRLASVSKAPTRAAIRELIDQQLITSNQLVFGPNGILSDILPYGGTFGTNVQNITVAHLHDHNSGLHFGDYLDDQAHHDEAAYRYGIPASELTIEDMIGLWISYPTQYDGTPVVPGQEDAGSLYASNTYAVLGLIVERVSGKELNQFFAQDLNAPDIRLAYERLDDRQLDPNDANDRETGYQHIGKETRSRWIELDEYSALSASAEGLTQFFYDHLDGTDQALDNSGIVLGPNGGGAMDGSHAGSVIETVNGVKESYAYIWNSDMPPSNRFEINRTIAQYGDLFPGSCDPTDSQSQGQNFRIDSVSHPKHYLHTGHSSNPGYTGDLEFSYVGNGDEVLGYDGVSWQFEEHNGTSGSYTGTYYVIRNVSTNNVLAENSAIVEVSSTATNSHAHWILHDDVTHFRLESIAQPGSFLTIDAQNAPRIDTDPSNGAADEFKWYLCN